MTAAQPTPQLNRAQRRAAAKPATKRSRPVTRRMSTITSDPIAFATAGNNPLPVSKREALKADQESWFARLREGNATNEDMLGFYGLAKMVETLCSLGSRGAFRYSVNDDTLVARVLMTIDRLCAAALKNGGRIVCRAADLADIRAVVDAHAGMYEIAIQSDLEKATRLMVARLRTRGLMPSMMEGQVAP